VDFPALFRGIEGFVPPTDPQAFLRQGNNWVPLAVLRELLSQCERITGRKDAAYLAARAYFDHGRDDLLTLFEIIFRVLNDVRSVVLCSHLWATVQTIIFGCSRSRPRRHAEICTCWPSSQRTLAPP
jgi:hypothetical protein